MPEFPIQGSDTVHSKLDQVCLQTKWLRIRNPDQNRTQTSLPAQAPHPKLARADYDCHRTREQLHDLVQIAVTGLDSAHPQLDSLFSFLVPQIHSSDQSSLGFLFIPPSALIKQVVSFQHRGDLTSSKQPQTCKVLNPAPPVWSLREAEGQCHPEIWI